MRLMYIQLTTPRQKQVNCTVSGSKVREKTQQEGVKKYKSETQLHYIMFTKKQWFSVVYRKVF